MIDAAFDDDAVRAARRPGGRRGSRRPDGRTRCGEAAAAHRPGVPDVYQGSELWETASSIPTTAGRSTSTCAGGCCASSTPARGPTGRRDRRRRSCSSRAALRLRRIGPSWFTRYRPLEVVGARPITRSRSTAAARRRSRPDSRSASRPRGAAGARTRRGADGASAGRRRRPSPAGATRAAPRARGPARAPPVALLVRRRGRLMTVRGVGAPGDRVALRRAGHAGVRWTVPSGRLVARRRPGRGDEYGFVLDDDEPPLPDPRSRRQPRGVHGPSARSTPRARVGGCRVDGRQLAGGVVYELHVGTFTPEGTLDAADRPARPPRRPRHRLRRAAAGQRVQRRAQLGLRRRALVRRARGIRRPGRVPALRRRLPRARPRGDPGRRLQPPRPERELPARVRAVPAHGRAQHLGRLGEPRRLRRGATLHRRERADVAARLPRRRAAARCGARARRPPARCTSCEELAERVDALSAHPRPAAHADRRVRPQRPDADPARARPAATASPRSGATTTTTRCTSRSRARPTGYYADFAPLDALVKTWTGGFFHDGTFSSFRGRDHGARSTAPSRRGGS